MSRKSPKDAVHKLIYGRNKLQPVTLHEAPALTTFLLTTSMGRLRGAVHRSVSSGDLHLRSLPRVLDHCKKFSDYDRAVSIARLYREIASSSSPQSSQGGHQQPQKPALDLRCYHSLMGCAVTWTRGLKVWNTMLADGVRPSLESYKLLLETQLEKWSMALSIHRELQEDQRVIHNWQTAMALLNPFYYSRQGSQVQRSQRWSVGWNIYTSLPLHLQRNANVVARMISLLHQAEWIGSINRVRSDESLSSRPPKSFSELSTSNESNISSFNWIRGLKLFSRVAPSDRNTALCNALLLLLSKRRTFSNSVIKRRAVELFQLMRKKQQEEGIAIINSKTYEALMYHRLKSPSYLQTLMEQCTLAQLPVPAALYTQLFKALFCCGRTGEAFQLFQKLVQENVVDISTSQQSDSFVHFSLHRLYVAVIDALLAHPFPSQAVQFAEEAYEALASGISEATHDLGRMGSPLDRWIVEGKVAIIDNTILNTRPELFLDDFRSRFDSILIPFVLVRQLKAKLDEDLEDLGEGIASQFVCHRHLRWLSMNLFTSAYQMLQVFPLMHQLQAHVHAVPEDGPSRPLLPTSAASPLLTSDGDNKSESEKSSRVIQIRREFFVKDDQGERQLNNKYDHLQPSSRENRFSSEIVTSRESKRGEEETEGGGDDFSQKPPFNSENSIAAMALFIKKFNPDAQVFLVSQSPQVLDRLMTYCRQSPQHRLIGSSIIPLCFPSEVDEKAPKASTKPAAEDKLQKATTRPPSTSHHVTLQDADFVHLA